MVTFTLSLITFISFQETSGTSYGAKVLRASGTGWELYHVQTFVLNEHCDISLWSAVSNMSSLRTGQACRQLKENESCFCAVSNLVWGCKAKSTWCYMWLQINSSHVLITGNPHTQFNFLPKVGENSVKCFLHLLTYEKTGLDKLLSGSPKVIQLECGGITFWTQAERGPKTKAALPKVVVSFKDREIYI